MSKKLVVASYCTTFLKSEMLHIYRQVTALRDVKTFVMTKQVQNKVLFPFDDIELIPKPRLNPFRHGWLKFIERRPPVLYRGEYQRLAHLLERRGADLMIKDDSPDYARKLRRVFESVPLVFARSRSLKERLMRLGCPPERIRIN